MTNSGNVWNVSAWLRNIKALFKLAIRDCEFVRYGPFTFGVKHSVERYTRDPFCFR